MYEIGNYIGNGTVSAFFEIRGHPLLGIKIMFKKTGNTAKKLLTDELNKARIVRKLGISAPRYVDVIQIKIPEDIREILKKASQNQSCAKYEFNHELKDFFKACQGDIVWGLVMEYIEDDVVVLHKNDLPNSVDKKKIEYIYTQEREKIEKLGIRIRDSDSNLNVIWSESRGKLYFIDFEYWDLSNIHSPIKA